MAKRMGAYLVPNWLTRDAVALGLSAYDIAVYVAINSRIDSKTRTRWMSIADIAKEAGGIARNTAKKSLAHLQSLGLVVVSGRSDGTWQQANSYYVPWFEEAPVHDTAPSVVTTRPTPVTTRPTPGQEMTEGGHDMTYPGQEMTYPRSPGGHERYSTGTPEGAPEGTHTGALEGGVGETTTAIVAVPVVAPLPSPEGEAITAIAATDSHTSPSRSEHHEEEREEEPDGPDPDLVAEEARHAHTLIMWDRYCLVFHDRYGHLPNRDDYTAYGNEALLELIWRWQNEADPNLAKYLDPCDECDNPPGAVLAVTA